VSKIKAMLTRKYTAAETIGIILIIVAIGTTIDLFMGRFSIFFIAFATILSVVGFRWLKTKNSFVSYIILACGVGLLLFSIFTSFSFTLIFAVLIVYNAYQLFRSSSNPSKVDVNVEPNPFNTQAYVQIDPYFKNKIVGQFRSIPENYAVEDINIQTGFGDVSIDLLNTIIPAGETVILIRGVIGNIYLDIPSDVGLSVQMSLFAGKMKLLQDSKTVFNQTQKFQTADYKSSARKVKIVTSLLVGDIEVKHR